MDYPPVCPIPRVLRGFGPRHEALNVTSEKLAETSPAHAGIHVYIYIYTLICT